ncbi:hypothetical protein [Secundilactobacillus kimchicus]|uniref:hypothetical protein n=1 Tax=Secundilactobacillus kimchicus TaxID=528209 RepID=UPI000ABCD90E|nr:hypothetical protein [Secundilactobacillus kimchicus]
MTKKIPNVRFKGFNDPWEQRKLSELGTHFSGLSGKNKDDFGHGTARYVTYRNVYANPFTSGRSLDAVEIDLKQTTVQYGDVFFTVSSETPNEVGMSSVWMKTIPDVYLNSFCFGFRPFSPTDAAALYYGVYFRSPYFRREIVKLAQGISRYNISAKKSSRVTNRLS